jgi:hypothetical protein
MQMAGSEQRLFAVCWLTSTKPIGAVATKRSVYMKQA